MICTWKYGTAGFVPVAKSLATPNYEFISCFRNWTLIKVGDQEMSTQHLSLSRYLYLLNVGIDPE